MPLARTLSWLPLSLFCAILAAQDPAPKPAETSTAPKAEAQAGKQETGSGQPCHHPMRFGRHSTFGAYVQGALPLRDLKESLDGRTGFGLGVQWTHDHGDWHASRTRLEWNTFPEGIASTGTRTYAKNYLLSWDHLFKLNQGESQPYLVAGIGGARWDLEQTMGGLHDTRWTTKPVITGGAGMRIAQRVNLEARYVVGSINKTFDANSLQMSLGWRF